MSKLRDVVDGVQWGGEPPAPGTNHRSGTATSQVLATLAYLRPWIWGHVDVGDSGRARITSTRMRDLDNLEAVARGTVVWFRYRPQEATDA